MATRGSDENLKFATKSPRHKGEIFVFISFTQVEQLFEGVKAPVIIGRIAAGMALPKVPEGRHFGRMDERIFKKSQRDDSICRADGTCSLV